MINDLTGDGENLARRPPARRLVGGRLGWTDDGSTIGVNGGRLTLTDDGVWLVLTYVRSTVDADR